MENSRGRFARISLLRLAAVFGVCFAALTQIYSSSDIQPRQEFSLYVMFGIGGAAALALLYLSSASRKLLNNLDLLVPFGVFIGANQLISFGITSNIYFNFNQNGLNLDFANLTLILITSLIAQLATWVVFVGWTTRAILQIPQGDKIDLFEAFRGVGSWFWRSLAVSFIFHGAVILLFLPFLPFVSSAIGFLIPVIIGLALILNLTTYAVLPTVLSSTAPLVQSIKRGIQLSWQNRYKLAPAIILQMLIAGWIVVVAVTYETKQDDKTEFGASSLTSSVKVHSKQEASGNFIWVGDYITGNKWHTNLMKAVEASPLPSAEFRIELLMLLLAIIVKIQIVKTIWGEGERFENDEFHDLLIAESRQQLMPFVIALVVLCLMPFELLLSYAKQVTSTSNSDVSKFVVPKVFTGEGFLKKSEVFKIGQHAIVVNEQSSDNKDVFPISYIKDVLISEKNLDFIVGGLINGLILDKKGNLKEKIQYKLGQRKDGYPAYFTDLKVVDLEDDGIYEFVGAASYPKKAFLLNSQGEIIWSFGQAEEGSSIKNADVKDLDGDGKKEIIVQETAGIKFFNLKGQEKWEQKIPSGLLGRESEFIDIDGDKRVEIITADYNHGAVRKLEEDNARKIEKPYYIHGFLVSRGEKPLIMFLGENKLGLFDFEGNLLAKYDAPLSHIDDTRAFKDENLLLSGEKFTQVFRAKGTKVKFKSNEPAYLAVLATLSTKLNEAYFVDMLYLYNANGELIYQESIQNGGGFLRTFINEDRTESLLVAQDEIIWSYTTN